MAARPFQAIRWRLILIIAGTFAFVAFIVMEKPKAAKDPAVFETLRHWIAGHYVPIRKETASAAIEQVPIFVYGTTNTMLIEKARQAAARFLLAFSTGDYQDYERFRFPLPASLVVSNYLNLRRELSDTNTRPPSLSLPPVWAVDSNYLAMTSNVWPPHYSPPQRFQVQQLTESNFSLLSVQYYSANTWYKGYFEAVCPTNSYIAIQVAHKNPEPLESLVRREENIGFIISGTPFYRFEHSPEELLSRYGQLTIVTTKLMVRLRPPDTVAPFYIRHYFDPENDALLPFGYVVANTMSATYVSTWF